MGTSPMLMARVPSFASGMQLSIFGTVFLNNQPFATVDKRQRKSRHKKMNNNYRQQHDKAISMSGDCSQPLSRLDVHSAQRQRTGAKRYAPSHSHAHYTTGGKLRLPGGSRDRNSRVCLPPDGPGGFYRFMDGQRRSA